MVADARRARDRQQNRSISCNDATHTRPKIPSFVVEVVVVVLAAYHFSSKLDFSTSQCGRTIRSANFPDIQCGRLDGSTNHKSRKLSAVAAFPCGCKNLMLGRIIPETFEVAFCGTKHRNKYFNWVQVTTSRDKYIPYQPAVESSALLVFAILPSRKTHSF